MADDKKNIPKATPSAEALALAVEKNAAVPEQLAYEPVRTDAEAVMLEHERQAALFEISETVPNPAPGKDDPSQAYSGKVVDFSAAYDEATKQKPPTEKNKVAKPSRGRLPKEGKIR